MAKTASCCLFLLLTTLSSSGGTMVGIPYAAAAVAVFGNISPSVVYRLRISSADDQVVVSLANRVVPVDLLVADQSIAEGIMVSRSAAILWLKSNLVVNTKSITLDGISMELSKVLPSLSSLHSAVRTLHLDSIINVSVEFPLSFLEKLSSDQARQVHRVLDYLRTTKSFVAVEARAELQRAGISTDAFRSQAAAAAATHSRAHQVSEFAEKVSKFVRHRAPILDEIPELYVQVALMDDIEEEHILPMASSRRELDDKYSTPASYVTVPGATTRDTVFPLHPTANSIAIPSTTSPAGEEQNMLHLMALSRKDSISPPTTIVTIPATTPTNPAATPVPIPSITIPVANPITPITNPVATPTTPVVTNPVTTPAVTNPVTTPAVTNPVTNYPSPAAGAGYVPVIGTQPPAVTSPVVAPPVTNSPATPGQSWCIARAGASEYALQSALDYACGIGGADCTQIQLGAGCYSPNTLQNHASFAFNSYYQRNPVAASCDFGGTAAIVATNPSVGSCLYATYSSSSQPVQTPSTAANNPATTTGTPAAAGAASSYGSPPSVLNSPTNPTWGTATQGFGSETPPLTTGISPSNSAALQPFTSGIVLATLFVIKVILLGL